MMITQNRIKTILTLAVVAMVFLVLTAASANAATMSASITAPDVGTLDIANYTGTSLDKWFCYAGEWASQPAGQTFTTGSDPVKFNAITYQALGTTPEKTYTIRVCTVNRVDPGDSSTWVLTEIHSETATQDFAWNSDDYVTWTLDEPQLLEAETEYGIDVGMNSTTSHWSEGIPYLRYSSTNQYDGGTRYHTGHQATQPEVLPGVGNETMVNVSGDRVFHIDLSTADPNLPSVDAGADMISWSGQGVPLDPNVVNNDPCEPQGTLTYLWTAEPNGIGDPNLDVIITDADPNDPNASVTITKAAPTGDVTVVEMTLAVTLEDKDPVTDTMTIDVYDDACLAAKAAGPVVFDSTDIDENCITNFEDFAVLAITWLDDYTLTGPVPK